MGAGTGGAAGDGLAARLASIAREAGERALAVRGAGLATRAKGDGSPVTDADLASEAVVLRRLARAFPSVPVVSEESPPAPFAERRGWGRLFLVDPLDGTRGFAGGGGEFTVNVALVEDGVPVAGAVACPAEGAVFHAQRGRGAWLSAGGGPPVRLPRRAGPRPWRILASRSAPGEAVGRLAEELGRRLGRAVETAPMGSALKICRIAEGAADLHPRPGPTMEWDTAAPEAVLAEAGGRVVGWGDPRPLAYNTRDLANPPFLAGSEAALLSLPPPAPP